MSYLGNFYGTHCIIWHASIIIVHQVDALLAADAGYPKIAGTDGKLYSLSEACQDVCAFSKLSDDVVTQVRDNDYI